MRSILVVTLLMIGLSASALHKDTQGRVTFLPKNNLRVSALDANNGMDRATYDKMIDRVYNMYVSVVKAKGGKLVMNREWTNDEVNSSADRSDGNWNLNIYGGLSRHPLMNVDGMTMVICHELGHQIGGAPKIGGYDWAANEGEADYYGATKCFRRVFASDDNIAIMKNVKLDQVAVDACNAAFSAESDKALCQRGAAAGRVLADLFVALTQGDPINFDTPDSNVVSDTDDEHPASQCRLDTYFQGSLCNRPYTEAISDKNPAIGACTLGQGFTTGIRPHCWYHPATGE